MAGFIADYLVGRARKYERWELFVVGMVGSFVGGAIGSFIEGGDLLTFRPSGLIGSIVGAIIVLVMYGPVRDQLRKRTDPPATNTYTKNSSKKSGR